MKQRKTKSAMLFASTETAVQGSSEENGIQKLRRVKSRGCRAARVKANWKDLIRL